MSTFTFSCPLCNQKIEADESMREQVALCPNCNEEIFVEDSENVDGSEQCLNYSTRHNIKDNTIKEDCQFTQELSEMGTNVDEIKNKNEKTANNKLVFKKIFQKLFIFFCLILLVCGVCGIWMLVYQQKQTEERRVKYQKNAEFQQKLNAFAISGYELIEFTKMGISKMNYSPRVAKNCAHWQVLRKDIPQDNPGFSDIDNAIKAWKICEKIWDLKIDNKNSIYLMTWELSLDEHNFLKSNFPEKISSDSQSYDSWISDLFSYARGKFESGYERLKKIKEL